MQIFELLRLGGLRARKAAACAPARNDYARIAPMNDDSRCIHRRPAAHLKDV